MGSALGREVEVRGIEEKIGEGGRKMMLVVLGRERDRDEFLERMEEIWGRWRIEVKEDLTMEERKMRWRIKERARVERAKGAL